MESDGAPRRGEGSGGDIAVGQVYRRDRGSVNSHRKGFALGVGHLRGQGTHPDQLVKPKLVPGQASFSWGAEVFASRPDGLMGFLSVFHLRGVDARLVRNVVGTIELGSLVASRVNGLLRQGHRVGTHVGDVAAFVEILGDRHGALGGEAELATCFLLQGRGTEGGVRAAGVRLGLHLGDGERSLFKGLRDSGRGNFVKAAHAGNEVAVGVEVAAGGDLGVIEGNQAGLKLIQVGG